MHHFGIQFIIAVISSRIIHVHVYDDTHYKDLYFEVVEPSDINYTFRCRPAKEIGTTFNRLWKDIYLVPTVPVEACSPLEDSLQLKGNIAFMKRGTCSFVTKIVHAQESGAIGAIIIDNDSSRDDHFIEMIDDSSGRAVLIPAMSLQFRDGNMILNAIEKHRLIGARINIPLNLTYEQMLKAHRAPGSFWL